MTETRESAGGRANRPMSLDRARVQEGLREAAEALGRRVGVLGRWVHVAHDEGWSGGTLRPMADTLALMLLSPDEMARRVGAESIRDGLIDPALLRDPTWWACDLARALAREIGYIDPYVTRTTARYILHVSRQAVDQMVARGDLDAVRGQGQPAVTRESLARAARRRYPYTSDTGQLAG